LPLGLVEGDMKSCMQKYKSHQNTRIIFSRMGEGVTGIYCALDV
jgi:hypothetical protein